MTVRRCHRLTRGLTLAVLVTGGAVAQPGLAQEGITVGAGGALLMGSGQIIMGCTSLTVAGLLDMAKGTLNDVLNIGLSGQAKGEQGVINLSGDWSNSGAFDPGSSTVNMKDGCKVTVATIAGNTTFHNLTITTTSGRQINFTTGSTQGVNADLTLNGVAGNLLKIRSTTAGSPGFLVLDDKGSQNIDHVDVRDNHAPLPGQYLAPGLPSQFNSVDGGGNFRWFLYPAPPVNSADIPTLSPLGMAALIALMMAMLWRRRRLNG